MPFGQLVIGPPGSGKTTYCNGVAQYLTGLGRKVALVNLDPANDGLPYIPAVDVGDLVDLDAVMDQLHLGPNGGMLYCMEYLSANLDWLQERLAPLADSNHYFIFDCPGQVELFTGQEAFKQVLTALTGGWHYRLAAVHLVDAHLATDPSKYLSALLLSLSTMLNLELPQVNVLSKVDLVPHYGQLAFNLEYYTQVQDLTYLIASMGSSPFSKRFRKLSQGLADVVEGYGLVGFTPLAVQDEASISRLVGQVDKANGACYARLDRPPVPVPAELLAASGHTAAEDELDADLQEKYIDSSSRKHSSKARSTAAGATDINTASSSAQDGGVPVSRQQTNAAPSSGGQQEHSNSSSTSQHGLAAREKQPSAEQQQQPCRQDVLQPAGTDASSAIQQQQQLLGADVAAVAAAAAAAASHQHEIARHALSAVGSTGVVVERHTAAPDPVDLSS